MYFNSSPFWSFSSLKLLQELIIDVISLGNTKLASNTLSVFILVFVSFIAVKAIKRGIEAKKNLNKKK